MDDKEIVRLLKIIGVSTMMTFFTLIAILAAILTRP